MRDFARPIRLPKRNKTSKIRPASGLTSVYINGPQNARTSEGEKWKNAPKGYWIRSVRPYGLSTIRFAPKRPMCHRSGVTSCSTTDGIRERWASQKSRHFSPIWLWNNT